MKSMKSFSVRSSGRQQGKFYIDCSGYYSTGDIAGMIGMDKKALEDIYTSQGAVLDDTVGVFYFPSRESAVETIKKLEDNLKSHGMGKVVFLTFEEIEYIRQALINEGSNIIYVRNDLKKCIFDKFNS